MVLSEYGIYGSSHLIALDKPSCLTSPAHFTQDIAPLSNLRKRRTRERRSDTPQPGRANIVRSGWCDTAVGSEREFVYA